MSTPTLPPIPDEILTLEAELKALDSEIEQFEQGTHPACGTLWKTLGKPAIEAMKQKLEDHASRRSDEFNDLISKHSKAGYEELEKMRKIPEYCPDSELLDNANNLPSIEVMAAINTLKKRKEIYRQLSSKQSSEFWDLIRQYLSPKVGSQFRLENWMKLSPQFAARRYVFAGTDVELLRKAESNYSLIVWCDEFESKNLEIKRKRRICLIISIGIGFAISIGISFATLNAWRILYGIFFSSGIYGGSDAAIEGKGLGEVIKFGSRLVTGMKFNLIFGAILGLIVSIYFIIVGGGMGSEIGRAVGYIILNVIAFAIFMQIFIGILAVIGFAMGSGINARKR